MRRRERPSWAVAVSWVAKSPKGASQPVNRSGATGRQGSLFQKKWKPVAAGAAGGLINLRVPDGLGSIPLASALYFTTFLADCKRILLHQVTCFSPDAMAAR